MVQAIDSQNVGQYIDSFTKFNRDNMEAFRNVAATEFFKERSAKIANIKELPKDIGEIAALITENEQLNLNETRVFYAELNFKVDKQEKWLYNGINHRAIVVTKEDGAWKIVRMSVPEIEYIVEKRQGFNTEAEKSSLKIAEFIDREGTILDNQGNIIGTNRASEAQLQNERAQKRQSTDDVIQNSPTILSAVVNLFEKLVTPKVAIAADWEHTRPDTYGHTVGMFFPTNGIALGIHRERLLLLGLVP